MSSKVGKVTHQSSNRGRIYRGRDIRFTVDAFEMLLITVAARMSGENVTDFVREAAVNMALVAVDTGRKFEIAKAKGLKLYGEDPANDEMPLPDPD